MSERQDGSTNIFEQLKNALIQRLDSPIVGSFLTIWCVANWELLVYLVFSSDSTTRVADAKMYLGQAGCASLLYGPLGLTLLYLIAAPLLHWLYSNFLGWVREGQGKQQIAIAHRLDFYRQWGIELPKMFKLTRSGVQTTLSKFDQLRNLLNGLKQFQESTATAGEALKYLVEAREKLDELERRLKAFEAASAPTLDELWNPRDRNEEAIDLLGLS